MRKVATLRLARETARIFTDRVPLPRTAKVSDFEEFAPSPGFLYVATRGISSRVNANFDGWPAEEIRKSYRTFIGRPIFVDHHNYDSSRARGVVLDALIHDDKLASGHDDVWAELLVEVDAQTFPRLAQAILGGDIDAVSMGADVQRTICSACGNIAYEPSQFCAHIPAMKGKVVEVFDKTSGRKKSVMVWEDCEGINFFELSFVFDPADESALNADHFLAPAELQVVSRRIGQHIRKHGEPVERYHTRVAAMTKVARRKLADEVLMALPEEVDTLHEEKICPQCSNEFDGLICQHCGFEQPPEGLDDPDTEPDGMTMEVREQAEDNAKKAPEEAEEPTTDKSKSKATPQEPSPPKKGRRMAEKKKPSEKKPVERCSICGADLNRSRSWDCELGHPWFESDGYYQAPGSKDVYVSKSRQVAEKPKGGKNVSRFVEVASRRVALDNSSFPNAVGPYEQAPDETSVPAAEAPTKGTGQTRNDPGDANLDLDTEEVQGGQGQSEVTVKGDQVKHPQEGQATGRRARAVLLAKAETARRAAEFYRRKADVVLETDVTNLDSNPISEEETRRPQDTQDPEKPVNEGDQLNKADRPDSVNDGAETGLPVPPTRRDSPFNEVGPYKGSSRERDKFRVLRIANFVDDRIALGLTLKNKKMAEIGEFEKMPDEELEGYIRATEEFKEVQSRGASRRIKVSGRRNDQDASRFPDLSSPVQYSRGGDDVENERVADYLALI